jgi:hypothetical protein
MAARDVETVELVFTFVRRLVVFGLGCWVIGNALINPEERVSQLLIGMVMVGVLPIENVFSWHGRRDTDAARHPPPPVDDYEVT